ncbi:coproporphyrinogen-III oxidase family protein [Rhizobium leguminosarum]|uniref:coproporphyrinogen-III oxidase family protein n=1 Tax=Rhizobium leguminosarum TaxID=384 RepID=UPI001AE3AD7C|nr:coproporphyrinogen-III oxidase family protein [Rhizobium leguminosarum]MBP2449838.1 oxygen-independent coproporphyrinogen-3 oxidase [Rhizobium leguminosarum]MBP2449903.1 oxygen-independent coproporphyrinogen-3 oxidase [Rhizobium leguminosarum]
MSIVTFSEREPIGSSTYPLPTHDVDAARTRDRLRSTAPAKYNRAILYVHIPFCDQVCSFCGFTRLVGHDDLKDAYMACLIEEIKRYGATPYMQSLRVSSVFFGGGTANSLSPEHLALLLKTIRDNFNLNGDCEVTCEGTPQNFTSERLAALKEGGTTRLSAGMQTFDRTIRVEHMNMPDGKDHLLRCIELMRGSFDNFNLDFIYNLPGHSMDIWVDDLENAIASGATHLTIYPLVLLKKTAFYTDYVKKNRFPPPDQDKEIEYCGYTLDRLQNSPFVNKYSANDWAVPDRESRHIIRDAKCDHVIAVGAVAHGYVAGMIYKNIRAPQAYMASIQSGDTLPIDKQHFLTREEEMERYMMMGLRLKKLALSDFEQRFDRSAYDVFGQEINDLVESDYIRVDDEVISFTRKGDIWHNNIRTHFERQGIPCVGYSDTIGLGETGKNHYA